ncbi:MAG: DUF2065 domain-containing protein [Candidatus Schekmanbacteria bacterium]|nr:DUF2065 domain-containing protein [Candidatus Schekmanbacteria bacterium]
MDFFVCALGLVLILEGMPYFISPPQMKRFIRHLLEMPDEQLRKVAFFSMLLGLLLVYLGRKFCG